MKIIHFELISNGEHIGSTPIREQAVAAAKAHANRNGVDVDVIATLEDGNTRKIIVKPDGSVDKVWQRSYIEPVPGVIYHNRNGVDYKCIEALSDHSAIMERVTDKWTFTAHGVQRYHDGTIEWNYSTGGRWPNIAI